jgi:vacuolar-type H+-ATPase subunit E/Vma4
MALAELVRTLERDAAARAKAILAKADEEVAHLVEARAAALERSRAAALGAREAELRARAARVVEAARHEAAARVLEARAAALERIRNRVEALLDERAHDPAALPTLAADLEPALEAAGPGAVVVEAHAELLGLLRERLAGRASATLTRSEGRRPGLVVRAADGSMTVDATVGRRLARAWPRLAIALAARLEALE